MLILFGEKTTTDLDEICYTQKTHGIFCHHFRFVADGSAGSKL